MCDVLTFAWIVVINEAITECSHALFMVLITLII